VTIAHGSAKKSNLIHQTSCMKPGLAASELGPKFKITSLIESRIILGTTLVGSRINLGTILVGSRIFIGTILVDSLIILGIH
jgi:hypothetical protein